MGWRTELACEIEYSRMEGRGLIRQLMVAEIVPGSRILIVEDVQETRDSIEDLLKHDGYRVDAARDEIEAMERAERNHPDLILVSLAGAPEGVIAAAQRIRLRGRLSQHTPIVIFSLGIVPQGAEEELSGNIYVTVPDNFNQLRALLTRILRGASRTH